VNRLVRMWIATAGVVIASAAVAQEQLYTPALGPVAPTQGTEALADAPPDQTGWGTAAGLRYLEIVRGGASPDEKLPLLLVIHGLGDKPHHDWLRAIDVDSNVKVRMILPQAPTPHGEGFSWFPFRAGSLDQAALARGISAAAERLTQMITVLHTQRPTRGRSVVSGFSQGGMLSYAVALSRPELVECAVPISGMLPEPLWPVRAHDASWFPKIRSLHGKADSLVRFDVDQQLVERMRQLGYPVELVGFEATGHTITPAMSAAARNTLNDVFAPKKSGTPGRRRSLSRPALDRR
jgi:phospholipase/carboxylesterase